MRGGDEIEFVHDWSEQHVALEHSRNSRRRRRDRNSSIEVHKVVVVVVRCVNGLDSLVAIHLMSSAKGHSLNIGSTNGKIARADSKL